MSYPNYPNYPSYPASADGYPAAQPQQPYPGYPPQVSFFMRSSHFSPLITTMVNSGYVAVYVLHVH